MSYLFGACKKVILVVNRKRYKILQTQVFYGSTKQKKKENHFMVFLSLEKCFDRKKQLSCTSQRNVSPNINKHKLKTNAELPHSGQVCIFHISMNFQSSHTGYTEIDVITLKIQCTVENRCINDILQSILYSLKLKLKKTNHGSKEFGSIVRLYYKSLCNVVQISLFKFPPRGRP